MNWMRLAQVAGGAIGVAATGAAVGIATRQRSKLARERRLAASGTQLPASALGYLPAGISSSVVADDGVRLSCEEIDRRDGGRAAMTVVLVHGFALDRRSWHFQRLALSGLDDPAVRVVLYDLRSHGRSEKAPRESCTIDQLARDLDAVLRALAPEGPLVLVGHSMGGMTIMALAEQRADLFAERVAGVALLSTSAGEVGGTGLPAAMLSRRNPLTRVVGELARWQPGLVEGVRRLGSDVIWAMVRAYGYGSREVDPALVELVNDMIAANAVEALHDFVDTLGTHDRRVALPALTTCEVLVAGGDADRMTPFRHSEVIAAELPDSTLMRLPDTGHVPMLERPEAVNTALVELLGRAAARGRRWPRTWRRQRRRGA